MMSNVIQFHAKEQTEQPDFEEYKDNPVQLTETYDRYMLKQKGDKYFTDRHALETQLTEIFSVLDTIMNRFMNEYPAPKGCRWCIHERTRTLHLVANQSGGDDE